jgi:hypothetical protein
MLAVGWACLPQLSKEMSEEKERMLIGFIMTQDPENSSHVKHPKPQRRAHGLRRLAAS